MEEEIYKTKLYDYYFKSKNINFVLLTHPEQVKIMDIIYKIE